jgi:uncharacterized protein DUF992
MSYARLKAATLAIPMLLVASSAMAQDRVQVGTLGCDVSGSIGFIIGSEEALRCTFTPASPGPIEQYRGTISKLGLDIGVTTGGQMAWVVFAPTSRPIGALAGNYEGVSAEASVGLGLGANVLIGGSQRTIALQPVSVQAQAGLNLAIGVSDLRLRFVQ